MRFSKSIMDRLVFSDVYYLGKAQTEWKSTGRRQASRQETGRGVMPTTTTMKLAPGGKEVEERKNYTYDKKNKTVHVNKVTPEKRDHKEISANAAHEKELKNASLHATLDSILEKGRPGKNKAQGGKKKAELPEGELVVPDSQHVQTMGNPGPTEAEHYERTSAGSKRNLAKLAESKSPMDRKAAAAGMKRHD